jgi:hypothetical protein
MPARNDEQFQAKGNRIRAEVKEERVWSSSLAPLASLRTRRVAPPKDQRARETDLLRGEARNRALHSFSRTPPSTVWVRNEAASAICWARTSICCHPNCLRYRIEVPYTTRGMPAQMMALSHIGQGSAVVYKVRRAQSRPGCSAAHWLRASISPCQTGFREDLLNPCATVCFSSLSTRTAPKGARRLFRAALMACHMKNSCRARASGAPRAAPGTRVKEANSPVAKVRLVMTAMLTTPAQSRPACHLCA